MNIYLLLIPSILIFDYFISTIVRIFNLRALESTLPNEFKDIVDMDNFVKSQNYTRVNTNFEYITSTFSLLLSLLLIFSGFYNTVDKFVIALGFNYILTGTLFFIVLILITDILATPFSLYKTFIIEEKFGFNKTNFSTFIIDKLKGYLILSLLGIPLLAIILYFFNKFPIYAWFYTWVLVSLFSILIQPIFNLFIAPLFNKFTPLPNGLLLKQIQEYLKKVNFPVKKLEVMDGSKRSSHSNAYFSGFGNNKRITLFDTLLDKMDEEEIVSIIAHEVGHYKLKHIHYSIILNSIQSGIMLFILSLFIMNDNLFAVFKMENLSIYASLLFFSILYTPISMIMNIFFNFISRQNEYSADKYSAITYNKPDKLISALKKMSRDNLSNLSPHWLNIFMNYTHPPVIKRIKALKLHVK